MTNYLLFSQLTLNKHSWCLTFTLSALLLYPATSTYHTAAAAKSLQSCPTLRDPTDSLLPGPSVPGILQARTLEWVAISFSNAWKWKVKVKSLSRVWLLATPRTAAYQLRHPWDFPGKSTGVGCHCLPQHQPNPLKLDSLQNISTNIYFKTTMCNRQC